MTNADDTQFDSSAIGGVEQTPPGGPYETPWRLGNIRIDGLTSTPPLFAANREATLSCLFADVPGTMDFQARHQAARNLVRNGRDVKSWRSEGEAIFREDHSDPPGTQLALLAPLAPTATGDAPAQRPSPFEAMWVVIKGGEDTTTLAPEECTLDLDIACIARRAEFGDKQAVRDAFEVQGYDL